MATFQGLPRGHMRLAACISLVMLTSVLVVVAHAGNECCNPAHAGTPAPPNGGNAECYCKDSGTYNGQHLYQCGQPETLSSCTGDQWQDAVAGACQTKTDANCAANAAQTFVKVFKGRAKCSTATTCTQSPDNCDCGWEKNTPEEGKDISVANCTGDGC
jgi:hypothetical protein